MSRKKEDRIVQVHFRVTHNEFESIKKNSEESGLTLSEYCRRALTGERIVAAPPADFYVLIREIKRVGSNINQILRKINILGTAHSLELERCATQLHEVLDLIYQTYRPRKGEG